MKKLAIIHHHLNRGGVTQVISNQLRALDEQVPHGTKLPVVVICGGRRDGWLQELTRGFDGLEVSLMTVGELDYDNVRPKRAVLAEQLQTSLQQAGFRSQETILHVHNHSLGKNAELPGALTKLAADGYATLLQIHDFAEDFRPGNYRQMASDLCKNELDTWPGLLYPQAPQIHYAVLNGRDHSILLEAGVDSSRLHLLPNAVAEVGPLPPREMVRAKLADRFGVPVDHRFLLYPVRGIRRKNLGEALLWSALAVDKTSFGLTLSPLNPVEQTSYARWKKLAMEIDLPWIFEAGGSAGLAYVDNLAAADLILTTSVAEGFGFVFLESWLAGRRLVGRDLPEITADFVAAGMRLSGLQPQLLIPVDWVNDVAFRAGLVAEYQNVLASYGRPLPEVGAAARDVDKLIHGNLIDFAYCGTSTQQQLIRRVANNSSDRDRLMEINPQVAEALGSRAAHPSLIEHNANVVRSKYSLASCGRRLLDIYRRIASSDCNEMPQPLSRDNRILERFLDLSRFHPLRVES